MDVRGCVRAVEDFFPSRKKKKKNFDHKSQFQYVMICNVG